jgi:uncharacterized repeat protein (TIGR04138 family)
MHEISFEDAVRTICERDGRIDRDAYYFLREALEDTVAKIRADETPEHQHVNGPELMAGFREFALEKFGPMAATVLETWGIRETDDVGKMVFDLIEEGAFGQSEEDHLEDFCGLYNFDEAFRAPFRPRKRRTSKRSVEAPLVVRESSPTDGEMEEIVEDESDADSEDSTSRDTRGESELL